VIYDLEAPPGTNPILIPGSQGFIIGVNWANNNRLLVTVNLNKVKGSVGSYNYIDKKHAYYRTVSYDVRGQNAALLFSNVEEFDRNAVASSIADITLDDPDHVYMPLLAEYSPGVFHLALYNVDVNTGTATRFMLGSYTTKTFYMDGKGHVVARIDQEKQPLVDHLFLNDSGNWRETGQYDAEGLESAGVAGLTADGSALVRESVHKDTGRTGLVKMLLADGTVTPLYFDQKYDVSGEQVDPWTNRIIGYSIDADMSEDHYFDPKMQALQEGLEAAFPGNSVHAYTWDVDKQEVIVQVDGPNQPSDYFLLNRATHQAIEIGTTYPGLNDDALGKISPYPYKARDGLDIPAYLTLPPGKPAKNLPTVIMPHGGQMARDGMQFDWMAQFLANRGYAVLQPNFRGSSGYGKKFVEAGFGQWGLKMQDDVTDGVQKLIADGIADPKRICIVGASYGGYAALAGAAFTPDLYACAASWAGVTDLQHFLQTRSNDYGDDSAMIERWSRFIGDRKTDADKLDAASPAKNADRIKCPVLLLHGVSDTTVRIDQSEEMNDALQHAGKKVTFIKFENETHYMHAGDTRVRYLKELEQFLTANIGN